MGRVSQDSIAWQYDSSPNRNPSPSEGSHGPVLPYEQHTEGDVFPAIIALI